MHRCSRVVLCRARYKGKNTDRSKVLEFQRHATDTGSSEVQIALLSARVTQLSTHLKSNRKDYATRRGLEKILARRRHFMQYLYDNDRWASLHLSGWDGCTLYLYSTTKVSLDLAANLLGIDQDLIFSKVLQIVAMLILAVYYRYTGRISGVKEITAIRLSRWILRQDFWALFSIFWLSRTVSWAHEVLGSEWWYDLYTSQVVYVNVIRQPHDESTCTLILVASVIRIWG